MEQISTLTDTELADQILTWSGRIAAGEARLLALVAEFDQREAWAGQGLLSCAHWLSWKTGLSSGAAREKVRVARALVALPLVAASLGQGRMSFAQARALTRVATPDDQTRWVELCRFTTAAQLEKLVRGVARVRRSEADSADPEAARWRRRVSTSYDADGNLRVVLTLPAQDGALVTAAFEQVQAELDHNGGHRQDVSAETPTDADRPTRASTADALLDMARRILDAASPTRARRSRAHLTAQVDPISGWARLADGELLPPASLGSVAGLATILAGLPGRGGPPTVRPLTAADLARCDLDRSARLPGPALRELLAAVDGERCRFPGCTRHRRLHAHHVTAWSEGGGTNLANLVLLCGRHHTLTHVRGFQLVLASDRRLLVATAGGTPVPRHPDLPWRDPAALDADRRVVGGAITPDRVEARMDLGYCVAVLGQQAA